jgi:hypothetical protein
MKSEDSIENIKEALIKACVRSRPSYFKPFLFSEKVTCEPDKEGFYKFFKYMLAVSKKTSIGELSLVIMVPNPDDLNIEHYEFYDTRHLYPRLTIIVKESAESIYLDVLPF